ncbi:MAG: hypothetical protein AAF591_06215 [Verrucomicrobiota bacterium]
METDEHNEDEKEVEVAPGPSYAPPAMAMAIMFFFWGTLTLWPATVMGIGLMAFALGKWVSEIRENWKEEDEQS